VLLRQIFITNNNEMFVGFHVNLPMLQWNKRMFVWSWPVLDAQVGETDHNNSQVVERFLSFSKRDPMLFYGIRRNQSVTKDEVLNIMSVDVLLPKLPVVQFASFLRCIILLSLSYLVLLYIFMLSHKRYDFRRKKHIHHKMCVLFLFTNLFETFPLLRRIRRNLIKTVHRSSCKVAVILIRFYSNLNFVERFCEKS
jgi:hypothetical protein